MSVNEWTADTTSTRDGHLSGQLDAASPTSAPGTTAIAEEPTPAPTRSSRFPRVAIDLSGFSLAKFRRAPKEDHRDGADAPPEAAPDEADEPAARRPIWERLPLAGYRRETRVGVAAMLSFLILVAALVLNRSRKAESSAFGTELALQHPDAGDTSAASEPKGTPPPTPESVHAATAPVEPLPAHRGESIVRTSNESPPLADEPAPKSTPAPVQEPRAIVAPEPTAEVTLPPSTNLTDFPPLAASSDKAATISAPQLTAPVDPPKPTPTSTPTAATSPTSPSLPPIVGEPPQIAGEKPATALPTVAASLPPDAISPVPKPAEVATPALPGLPGPGGIEPIPGPAAFPGEPAPLPKAADAPPPRQEPHPPEPSPKPTPMPELIPNPTPTPEPPPRPTPLEEPAPKPTPREEPAPKPAPPEEPAPKPASAPVFSPAPPESIAPAAASDLVPIRNLGRRRPPDSITLARLGPSRAVADAPPPREDVDAVAPVDPIVHKVREGENFWTISRLYYPSGRYYKALHAANKRLVPNIRELYVGTTIVVPPIESLDPTLIDPPSASGAAAAKPESTTPPRASRAPADSGRPVPSRSRADVELGLPAPRSSREKDPGDADDAPTRPVYRVRANDTLRSIARETLGDAHRDREILNLNRDVIDDPKRLVSGQSLTLPEDATIRSRD